MRSRLCIATESTECTLNIIEKYVTKTHCIFFKIVFLNAASNSYLSCGIADLEKVRSSVISNHIINQRTLQILILNRASFIFSLSMLTADNKINLLYDTCGTESKHKIYFLFRNLKVKLFRSESTLLIYFVLRWIFSISRTFIKKCSCLVMILKHKDWTFTNISLQYFG